ncbi:hypothetical protein ACFPC0_33440 [Streptomyces andamanensis]|uniref:Uncharacterized protein n=1 Tax=Streptomyces andamanensis TaxID=1565035 RepID=A0ABV8TPU4_9ACTN
MHAAPRTATGRVRGCVPLAAPSSPPLSSRPLSAQRLVADRAVDLLRVSSALCTACTAPGRARRRA